MMKKMSILTSNNPLVSVIIPCYNVEEYVDSALASILNQDYKNIEIICIDDFSTDQTYNKLKLYGNEIILFQNPRNLGLINTLNKLVKIANGDYLLRMDPDDISETNRLSVLMDTMLSNNVDIVSSAYYNLDENGRRIKNKNIPINQKYTEKEAKIISFFNSPIPHAPALIKKSLFEKNQYNESYKTVEDFYLWSELLNKASFKCIILPFKLYGYRINQGSASSIYSELQRRSHYQICLQSLNVINQEKDRFLSVMILKNLNLKFQNDEIKEVFKELNSITTLYKLNRVTQNYLGCIYSIIALKLIKHNPSKTFLIVMNYCLMIYVNKLKLKSTIKYFFSQVV